LSYGRRVRADRSNPGTALGFLATVLAAGCAPGRAPAAETVRAVTAAALRFAPVTHGVAAGDVTSTSAVIWSRSDRYAVMHVRVDEGDRSTTGSVWVTAARDYTGKISIAGLSADTPYRYTVWFTIGESSEVPPANVTATGFFRTAPLATANRPLSFGWSGDLGGLNVCRDAKYGYPVFDHIDGRNLDFFIGLGDMIYGDQACKPIGLYGNAQIEAPVAESTTVRNYWAHWKYNREDPGLRRLLASTGYYGVWDDHEVMNDFGPRDDWHRFPPYVIGASLLPLGRQALLDYSPISENADTPNRLYRSFRWGRGAELFLLDTRSYRDRNDEPDLAEHPKTLLGAEQRNWLEAAVPRSDATWKIVVSSVPLSVPTGAGGAAGHDGWANFDENVGFERELAGIWSSFRDSRVKNLVFVTTDVHFATGFRYRPFPESPEFTVYEFTAGPLNAMLLPTHSVDDSFHPERLFFYGPEGPIRSFEDAVHWMNWGRVSVDQAGTLSVAIIDGQGETVVTQMVRPEGTSGG
jgi:alkaline phosphatase D